MTIRFSWKLLVLAVIVIAAIFLAQTVLPDPTERTTTFIFRWVAVPLAFAFCVWQFAVSVRTGTATVYAGVFVVSAERERVAPLFWLWTITYAFGVLLAAIFEILLFTET
jgi:hypothetical protein